VIVKEAHAGARRRGGRLAEDADVATLVVREAPAVLVGARLAAVARDLREGHRYFRVLKRFLETVERNLALWCCLELDITAGMVEAILTRRDMYVSKRLDESDLAGVMPPHVRAQTWGPWNGRETDFFVECSKRIEPLSWEDVARIGGPEVGLMGKILLNAHEAIYSEWTPETLKPGPHELIQILPTRVRVKTYNAGDLLELEPKLLDALSYFDGRPVKQVLAQLKKERDIEIDPAMLRKLVDFQILVAAP
jgi:hypothetical protein